MTTSHTTARRVSERARPPHRVRSSNPPADPIFAAIAAHRRARSEEDHASLMLDRAESAARKKHGLRPCELIIWRNYHVMETELRARRDEFLKLPGISPKKINAEYRDAIKRARAAKAARIAWDRKAGVATLKARLEAATVTEEKTSYRMAGMNPRTLTGALALLNQTRKDMVPGPVDWHAMALDSVALALLEGVRKYELDISPRALLTLVGAAGRGGAK